MSKAILACSLGCASTCLQTYMAVVDLTETLIMLHVFVFLVGRGMHTMLIIRNLLRSAGLHLLRYISFSKTASNTAPGDLKLPPICADVELLKHSHYIIQGSGSSSREICLTCTQ